MATTTMISTSSVAPLVRVIWENGERKAVFSVPPFPTPAVVSRLEAQLLSLGIGGVFAFRFRFGAIQVGKKRKGYASGTGFCWTLLSGTKKMRIDERPRKRKYKKLCAPNDGPAHLPGLHIF